MAKFAIVAEKFAPDDFDKYVAGLKPQKWVKRIVLHNTASPSLAQRPGGLMTEQHIKNLHHYYQEVVDSGRGWSGAPHLFVDAEGIWVFNPLDKPGVHSPSYNSSSWGVEMLGDYSTESFTTGLGAEVRENSLRAVAALARLQGWPNLGSDRLILHKEDPATTHNCPGKNVVKRDFVEAASALVLRLVVGGKVIPGAFIRDGVSYAPVRPLVEALGATVKFDPAKGIEVVA